MSLLRKKRANGATRLGCKGADRALGPTDRAAGDSVHGGIGMTMEYKVGHYFKRMTMIDTMFGDVDHHLRELARRGWLGEGR